MVLVDTAGRMQDNAPLMTALAKLIAVNAPDLVLFVGEALVGNEAVDQLVSVEALFPERLKGGRGKQIRFCRFYRRFGQRQHHNCVSLLYSFPQVKFNKALADHSMAQTPRLIDGIVLTKFDTIDDKVRRPSRLLRTELPAGDRSGRDGNCRTRGTSTLSWTPSPAFLLHLSHLNKI